MINRSRPTYKHFRVFCIVLIVAAVSFLFMTLTVVIATMITEKTYNLPLCMQSSCIENASKIFSGAISFMKLGTELLTSFVTIGGIVFAILSYLNVAHANALNNHISHFNIFQDYIQGEVSKRSMIHPKHIDIFTWYNLIFDNSRNGSIDVSLNYKEKVKSINAMIEQSNQQCSGQSEKSFRYKEHQNRMIEPLGHIGISLTRHPRNDFFEIEGQILSLIETVNKAFTAGSSTESIKERKYI